MSVIFPQVPARLRRVLGRFVGPAGAAQFSLVLASCTGGGFGGAGDSSDASGVNPVSQPAPAASGSISPASQRKVAEAVSGLDLGEETPPISSEDIAVSSDSGILDSNPFSSPAPAARSLGWGARADSTRKTPGYKAFEIAVPSENPLMTVAVWISETPPDYPEGKPEQDPEADRKFLYLRLQVFIAVEHVALVEGGGVEILESEVIVVEEKRPDPKPVVPEKPEPQSDPSATVLVAEDADNEEEPKTPQAPECPAGEFRGEDGNCAPILSADLRCPVRTMPNKFTEADLIKRAGGDDLYFPHVHNFEFGRVTTAGLNQEELNRGLARAIDRGNEEGACEFLRRGADVDALARKSWLHHLGGGFIPLNRAVKLSNLSMVKFLLANGADLEARSKYHGMGGRFTPLMWAVHDGRSEIAELLIDRGADVNSPHRMNDWRADGWTPLHRANLRIAKKLAAHGADVNAANEDGVTPLHSAPYSQHGDYLAVADFLLVSGASVNARFNTGGSARDGAAKRGDEAFARLLWRRGGVCYVETGPLCSDTYAFATVTVTTIARDESSPVVVAGDVEGDVTAHIRVGDSMEEIGQGGGVATLQMTAYYVRRVTVIPTTTTATVRVETVETENPGEPVSELIALLTVTNQSPPGIVVEVEELRTVYEYPADFLAGPECPSGSLPTNGLTAAELNMTLRLAARRGDAARVCEALRRGAEVNDNLGDSEFTALQEAVDGGYFNVSELLLANEAEVNKRKGGAGRSPLDLAARDEEAEIAALLRNAGGRCFLETGPLCGDIPAATPDPATVVSTIVVVDAGYSCPAGSLPRGDHTQKQLDDNLHAAGWDLSAEGVCEWLRRGADVNAKRGYETLLHGAAWGDYEIAALLLANGADVNAKDLWDETPLYAAATRDDREMAALLLANGADVNVKNYAGAPLHEAARNNSEEVAALLLESGADVNAEAGIIGIGTPLHEAARRNSEEVAALLLANGAAVNVRAQWNGTPLHQAARHNSRGIVALLLANGADVNAKTIDVGNNLGGTALDIARRRGNSAVVALLEAVENPSIVSATVAAVAGYSCPAGSLPRGDYTQKQLDDNLHAAGWDLSAEGACEWLRRGADVNAKRGHETVLHGAAWGDYELAVLLLANGADVNAKDLWGKTPLYAAATRDDREMAALLLANGADVNVKNHTGAPLHEAARNNSEEVAALLLESGADVNAEAGLSGIGTPLHEAARRNSEEVAALLLAGGAAVNARAQWDGTPLHQAAYHNSAGVAALLLANGADVDAEAAGVGSGKLGGTALEIARKRGNSAIVAFLEAAENLSIVSGTVAAVASYSCPADPLPRGDHTQEQLDDNLHAAGWDLSAEGACEWLRRGADVNAKRGYQTLLHVAAWGKHELAALLLANGADVNAKDLWDKTPLYAAATRDDREMAALLLANGADVNVKNHAGAPLHEAARNNSEEVAALLLESGADVNAEAGIIGIGTPLHEAARRNSEEVAALLLAGGAAVNARAQWDGTPLHQAAYHNSAGVAALLLANGADVNAESVGVESDLGGTALEIARGRGNSAVVALLEAAENLQVAAEADALAEELRESFAGGFNPSPAFGDAFGAVSGSSEKFLTRLDSLMRATSGEGGAAWDSFAGWQRENEHGRFWFSTGQRGDFGFGAGGAGAGGDLSASPFAALAGNGMLAGGETGFGGSGRLRVAAFGDYQAKSLLGGEDKRWTQWAARGTAIETAMTEVERFSGLSENRTRGAMTEIHLGGGDLGVALQAGAVSESDSVLSGTAGNDNLRGLRSRTAFAGLSGAADLFDSGWRLRGSAHLGRSWAESEGMLRDSDLWASAFSAGLERGGWLYSDDGFVLRFSQPLRVESWEMELMDERGGRRLKAGSSGRQLDVDAAYRLPLSGGGWLLLSAGVRRDGGHSSSSDLEAGALFSVERGF